MEKIKELCRASKAAWDAGDLEGASTAFMEAQALAGEVKLTQLTDGSIGIARRLDSVAPEYDILSAGESA